MSSIQIIPVETEKQLKEFVRLPYRLYQKDPIWVPPLWIERWSVLHPKKNPFYQHAKVQLFLARQNGKTVGRISSQVDQEYEKYQGEKVGHFGFFESENNPEIAGALLETAEGFVQRQGVKRILGPFSFSINEESGLLVDGFDQPMMTMTPYNPPYYKDLITAQGFHKAKDLFAWWYTAGEIPEAPAQIAAEVAKYPGLKVRKINKKNIEGEIQIIMDVFHSAWSKNWGFVPLTPQEIKKAAKDMKPILDPEICFIAEVDGQPAGICLALPNIYELITGLKGKIFPFGFAKLLWRIKKRKQKTARLMLLGIKKEFRGSSLGGLSVLLYHEIAKHGYKAGYVGGELSWTLEDNHKINAGIEFMGSKKIKTFRVFEKSLESKL